MCGEELSEHYQLVCRKNSLILTENHAAKDTFATDHRNQTCRVSQVSAAHTDSCFSITPPIMPLTIAFAIPLCLHDRGVKAWDVVKRRYLHKSGVAKALELPMRLALAPIDIDNASRCRGSCAVCGMNRLEVWIQEDRRPKAGDESIADVSESAGEALLHAQVRKRVSSCLLAVSMQKATCGVVAAEM
jgi:hypothetical protein